MTGWSTVFVCSNEILLQEIWTIIAHSWHMFICHISKSYCLQYFYQHDRPMRGCHDVSLYLNWKIHMLNTKIRWFGRWCSSCFWLSFRFQRLIFRGSTLNWKVQLSLRAPSPSWFFFSKKNSWTPGPMIRKKVGYPWGWNNRRYPSV